MSKRIGENGFMLGAMYAPFCRTKYFDMSEWNGDLRAMHEMGYTCIHGFTEWWRVEKQKGVFDFSEPDHMISCAYQNGIVPILNVATQNGVGYYMPRWMMEEYKGTGMISNEGECQNPVDAEYRIACMDDPWYQMYAQRYLRAVAEHYAGDTRLGGYVIWGEPKLTLDGKAAICYCKHTIAKFKAWLRERYVTIDALNTAWGCEGPTQYVDFTTVRPPKGPRAQQGSYASWTDFRNFMDQNLAGHIAAADKLFKSCGATQPTIAELWYNPGNSNAWEMAKSADIIGVSNFDRPGRDSEMMMIYANSLAQPYGKSVFVVEAQAGPRYPNYDKRTPGETETVSEAAQMIGGNAKGVMYWCYRPRLSDHEGGTFGLCRQDGTPLPRAYTVGCFSTLCQAHADVLHAMNWRADAAVLLSRSTEHVADADSLFQTYLDGVEGAVRAMSDLYITPQFISEELIQSGHLKDFKVLLLPCAYVLDEMTVDAIVRFAEAGGLVIADHLLGMKRSNGTVYTQMPGGKLRELFGVLKQDVLYLEHPSLLPEQCDYPVPMKTCLDLVTAQSAQVEKRFGEWPLLTHNAYGRGTAVYMTWQAFSDYRRNPSAALREVLGGALARHGIQPYLSVLSSTESDKRRLYPQMLYGPGNERLLTMVNSGYDPVSAELRVPNASDIEKLFGPDTVSCAAENGSLCVHVTLGAWESAMLMVRP